MMPNMVTALHGFEDTMQFTVVRKTVVEGDIVEDSRVKPTLWFEGAIQPLHPKELLVKPEGERKWKWLSLFTDMDLSVDDQVIDTMGNKYRVMSVGDWETAGINIYQLVEGPGPQ